MSSQTEAMRLWRQKASARNIQLGLTAHGTIKKIKLNLTFEESLVARAPAFWAKVKKGNENECWEWLGHRSKEGYGKFMFRGINTLAHRLAYLMEYKNIDTGLFICHSCDNRYCVNPKHLWAGTNQDNVDDMVSKGRQAKGKRSKPMPENHGFHPVKLNENSVLEIRKLFKEGKTQKELSVIYGVDNSTISTIVNNKSWKHLK